MGIFSKEGIDVLDLPELQRKGLLKLPSPAGPEHDIIDLSKAGQPSVTTPINPPFSPPVSPTNNGSVSDFLSDFALIGANTSTEAPMETKKEANTDLAWRLENAEYKIEQLLEKIAELEKRITT